MRCDGNCSTGSARPLSTPGGTATRRVRLALVLLIGVTGFMLATRAAAEPLYDAASRAFDAGSGARFVVLADINSDGLSDAIVANYITPSVSLLAGQADGSFGAPQALAAGYSGLTAVAVGDLNSDGHLDLVYSDPSGFVGIRLGGPGGFAELTTYAVAGDAQWVDLGDVNGDGALDILTANRDPFYSHSVSILLGDGHGRFGSRRDVDFGVGETLTCAVTGDFDEDGRDDIAVTGPGGTVYVRLSSADTSFAVQSDFAVGGSPTAMAVADVNGDGHLDIVCGGSDKGTLLAGNGHGVFTGRTNLPVGGGMPVVADFNHDGRADIAFTGGGSVAVLLGRASGGFGPTQTVVTWSAASAIAAGDINGDGILDLVTADNATSDVSVMLGNGDGTFGTGRDYALGAYATGAAAGDLDGDGRMDVAVARSNPWVTLMKGQGDGTFAVVSTITLGTYVLSVVIRDLNADGIPDLVVGGGGVTVLLGTGGMTYAPPLSYRSDLFTTGLAVGDLNGDGIPDLAGNDPGHNADCVRCNSWIPGTTVHVWYGAGDGTFPAESTYTVGQIPYDVAIADMNGDGRNDLIVANAGSSTVEVLLADSTGRLGSGVAYPSINTPVVLAIADFNEDGHPDVATASKPVSQLAMQLGNPDGSLGAPIPIGSFNTPQALSAADLDGDGHVDLVVSAEQTNGVAILRGLGDGTFAAPDRYGTGSSPQRVAIGDFNGDGALDLAVPHPVGTVSVLMNRIRHPTPVLVSLIGVEASLTAVSLSWWSDTVDPSETSVERSADGVRWVVLGSPILERPRLMSFVDHTVQEGETYVYRLVIGSGAMATIAGQVTVRVPVAQRLDLAVTPNPIHSAGQLAVHLVSSDAARLEVCDIAGRRVWSVDIGRLGPGSHLLEFPVGAGLRSGAYWMRLSQANRTAVGRFAVVR